MSTDDAITALIGQLPQDHSVQPYSEESLRRGLELVARPSDVFVTTVPKTGTTLLTQVLHQLRCPGDMDFEDIYQVIPWPPLSWDLGSDCDADQRAEPRCFKTHQRLAAITRGGRYLCSIRDPIRTTISNYKFLGPSGKDIPPLRQYSDVSDYVLNADAFVARGMGFGASLWEYYVEFYKCRKLESVLVVVFEEMQSDLRALLPHIAKFAGLNGAAEDAALLDRVAAMCTKEVMMEHGDKFDESWSFERLKEVGRMPDPSGFVPAPRVTAGHGDVLSDEALAWLDKQWALQVTPHTGHATYADMAKELALLPTASQ